MIIARITASSSIRLPGIGPDSVLQITEHRYSIAEVARSPLEAAGGPGFLEAGGGRSRETTTETARVAATTPRAAGTGIL